MKHLLVMTEITAQSSKFLANYHSQYVKRMRKMAIISAGKDHRDLMAIPSVEDFIVVNKGVFRRNFREALFASWEQSKR